MSEQPSVLLGCGILQNEIRCLAAKNGWPLEFHFLDSALHVDFGALARGLTNCLARHAEQNPIVFYGACHPRISLILERAGATRTAGQNCIEMLLGPERFERELADGAFFLLDEWAHRWREVLTRSFDTKVDIIRDIFQHDRKYLLALRTPCSPDFVAEAEQAAEFVGLPLRWADVQLDELEKVLQAAIRARAQAIPCPV